MSLYLYLISQKENGGYDTYDSAVVCASDAEEARLINPGGKWEDGNHWTDWAPKPEFVTAELIGVAAPEIEAGVVLASFNAG